MLLYLYPNQTLFTDISEQRLLHQLHYSLAANSALGWEKILNLAAKFLIQFTKYTQKTNLQICIFIKKICHCFTFLSIEHQVGLHSQYG